MQSSQRLHTEFPWTTLHFQRPLYVYTNLYCAPEFYTVRDLKGSQWTCSLQSWCTHRCTADILYALSVHSYMHSGRDVYTVSALTCTQCAWNSECTCTHRHNVYVQSALTVHSMVHYAGAMYDVGALNGTLFTCSVCCMCTNLWKLQVSCTKSVQWPVYIVSAKVLSLTVYSTSALPGHCVYIFYFYCAHSLRWCTCGIPQMCTMYASSARHLTIFNCASRLHYVTP